MAQKRGKGDKAPSNEDGAAMILEYLRKQNRPYSAVDISSNLHNKVTKTHAVKALRELHQNKAIESRTAGKQTVYHAVQDQDPTDNTAHDAIVTLDEEIKHLEARLADLKATEKKARADLASLTSRPLLSDLRASITRLEAEKEATLARLAEFHGRQSGSGSGSGSAQDTVAAVVGPEERAEVEREWKRWQRQVAVRRRICRELWDRCSEVVPEGVTREELWESLGLEGCV